MNSVCLCPCSCVDLSTDLRCNLLCSALVSVIACSYETSLCLFALHFTFHLQSRLPELQELQQQLSAAHEEVADLQYAANEQQAVATQQAAAAAAQVEAADKVAKVGGQRRV